MNSREKLQATLNHQQPEGICVDMGSSPVTGIAASALARLRQAVLGDDSPVKITEPYQMLGEVEDDLRQALGIDVVGVMSRFTMFGFANENWKPFQLFDGTEVLVPGEFNLTTDDSGDLLIHPQGDTSVAPSGRMPKGGFYFDAICRQGPIDEDKLDPADNFDYEPIDDDALKYLTEGAQRLSAADYGLVMGIPAASLGDISSVPAPWRKQTPGIRDLEEWYMSTALRPDYIRQVFERQCEVVLENIRRMAPTLGDLVQVACASGTDFGTQRSLFCSLNSYRSLYKPFHKQINDLIHEQTNWKIFIHSCGSIRELIPDLIEVGFDILNPVQCSAANMEAQELKNEFGRDLVFWGGGVDTQQTLAFGTPEEVYDETRQRIDIFNTDGGFIFNTIHNIQATTPLDNMLAMFKAIKDYSS